MTTSPERATEGAAAGRARRAGRRQGRDAAPAVDSPVGAVTSTELHAQTSAALGRVRAGECLAVTHYNQVDAYLVPPTQLEALIERLAAAAARERELSETLPLVLAATRAGVAIPSETLDRLAPGLDQSWQAVADFAAAFPVRISRGEHGETLTRGRLTAHPGAVEEYGDDDELTLDA